MQDSTLGTGETLPPLYVAHTEEVDRKRRNIAVLLAAAIQQYDMQFLPYTVREAEQSAGLTAAVPSSACKAGQVAQTVDWQLFSKPGWPGETASNFVRQPTGDRQQGHVPTRYDDASSASITCQDLARVS